MKKTGAEIVADNIFKTTVQAIEKDLMRVFSHDISWGKFAETWGMDICQVKNAANRFIDEEIEWQRKFIDGK